MALTDVLSDGLSMVYSFFEPSEESRSLGTFMILDHIARARRHGIALRLSRLLDRGSQKMDYKGRFLPQQRLAPSGWLRVDAVGHQTEPQDYGWGEPSPAGVIPYQLGVERDDDGCGQRREHRHPAWARRMHPSSPGWR